MPARLLRVLATTQLLVLHQDLTTSGSIKFVGLFIKVQMRQR